MKLIGFSIRRPVTIIMLMVSMILFGFVAFSRLPINLLPDITYPTLTVQTEFLGAAPNEIENLISERVEEAVGVVSGVVRVSSISRPDRSDVVLEFAWGTNMDFASLDVREKIDLLNLPQEATKPILLRFDPGLDPILRIALYGDESLTTLRIMAEEEIKRELESLEGVAAVKVSGGLEEEIHVEIDEARLASLSIPISQIATRLAQENINLAGGTIKEGEAEYLVRILNEFKDVEEIGDIVIGQKANVPIILTDVADVVKSHKERKVSTRVNGQESIEIAIYKEAGSNTVSVAKGVKDKLAEVQENVSGVSGDVNMEVVFDQSTFIEQSVDEVLNTAIMGGILAVFVLFLFLRNSSTVIIGFSIPISVVATFFFLFVFDVSLNIMSLGGLALGIGMLVDNSIVVLESIDRYRKERISAIEAAEKGGSEVGQAVVAATLTTLCVFVPIVFVEGIAGQLFRDLALAVTFSLVSALLVAVTLIPMLASKLRSETDREQDALAAELTDSTDEAVHESFLNRLMRPIQIAISYIASGLTWVIVHTFKLLKIIVVLIARALGLVLSPLLFVFDQALNLLSRTYPMLLRWTLTNRAATLFILLLMLGGSLTLVSRLGIELIPEMSQSEFFVNVKLPVGAPLPVTERVLGEMASIAGEYDNVKTVYVLSGTMGQSGGNAGEERENIGQLHIRLDDGIRGGEEEAVINRMRQDFAAIPGIDSPKFARPSYFSFKAPIEVEVTGYSLPRLTEISDNIALDMGTIPGLTDVKSSMEGGNPEIQILFDRRRLANLGLQIGTVTQIVQDKVQGRVATELTRRDRRIDIRVWAEDETRLSLDAIRRLEVNPEGLVPIPLSAVAEVVVAQGPSEIRRINQQRVSLVSANLTGRTLGDVTSDIQRIIDDLALPLDFQVLIKGQNEEMQVAFESMQFAIILSVFLVYLVMASQFESLIHPFVILFTFPFSMVGVILTLLIANQTISVVVLIGVIMLAGIVVNNAIVLVDYVNQLRRSGLGVNEALLEAGQVRLRPILMTTATTVLGLLPMAIGIGEGAEIRAPMAITVIGGLTASTLVTLVLVPLIYTSLESFMARVYGLFGRSVQSSVSEEVVEA
ncbi:MAG: efflux RND transporter permease subunit [Candidatus Latescibacteria bacterium]|jgi:hydrophobic/amphiphilic exporter-1 (mainly G- bacteria), HAE1 family|nr:efflux RND transporter permease subunit [Candidatus Latescibacterota bacterium]